MSNPLRRFAIYLAPEPTSLHWQLAAQWLGYDAATGLEPQQPVIAGLEPEDLRVITAEPRLYGYHLTMKAPFRLVQGADADALETAIAKVAERHAALPAIEFGLEARIGKGETGFLCFVPTTRSEALHALERDCVTMLDAFRAPLTPAEYQRRKPETLSQRHRALLDSYGYPYVLDAFRPHFSLTGAIERPARLKPLLERHFSPAGNPLGFACAALWLYEQPEAGARFIMRRRFALGDKGLAG